MGINTLLISSRKEAMECSNCKCSSCEKSNECQNFKISPMEFYSKLIKKMDINDSEFNAKKIKSFKEN